MPARKEWIKEDQKPSKIDRTFVVVWFVGVPSVLGILLIIIVIIARILGFEIKL